MRAHTSRTRPDAANRFSAQACQSLCVGHQATAGPVHCEGSLERGIRGYPSSEPSNGPRGGGSICSLRLCARNGAQASDIRRHGDRNLKGLLLAVSAVPTSLRQEKRRDCRPTTAGISRTSYPYQGNLFTVTLHISESTSRPNMRGGGSR